MELTRKTLAKALVAAFVFNLIVMGAGAYLIYEQSPERPERIVGPNGETLTTNEQIVSGKAVFQGDSLMNHGSILGNGAYFGDDYTADALDRLVTNMRRYVARERYGMAYVNLGEAQKAGVDAVVEGQLEDNTLGDSIELGPAEAYAYRQVREEYVERYHGGAPEHGIPGALSRHRTRRDGSQISPSGRRCFPRVTVPAPAIRTPTSGRTTPALATVPRPRRCCGASSRW